MMQRDGRSQFPAATAFPVWAVTQWLEARHEVPVGRARQGMTAKKKKKKGFGTL